MTIHQQSVRKKMEQELLQVLQNETRTPHKKRYKINEIFYSVQGEGDNVGRAAIFIRFSACNLACTWCDTEYDTGVMMSGKAILAACAHLTPRWPLIVCTGGEPSLQMHEEFVTDFLEAGYGDLSMETNGIKWRDSMRQFDTVTVSPKTFEGWWSSRAEMVPGMSDWKSERLVYKVVYDPSNPDMEKIMDQVLRSTCRARFLQPLEDQHSGETNVVEVLKIVQAHPRWRLSLQTHKILNLR